MSKKIWKWLGSLSVVTPVTTFPVALLMSADPKIDPKFNEFEPKAKEELDKAIDEIIAKVVKYLNEERDKIDPNTISDLDTLSKRTYLEKIAKYYEDNKDDAKAHPEKYGFKPLLPYAISKNKKLKIVKVEYNNKIWENIKVGSDEELNALKEQVKPDGKVEIVKEIDNVLSKKNFDEIILKYVYELTEKFNSMVYQDGDAPKLEMKFERQPDGTYVAKISMPKDFETWDKWIKSKLVPRFNDFEFEQNNNAEIKGDEKEEKPDKVPLVPADVPKAIDKLDIDALPALDPLLDSFYADKTVDELKNLFTKDTANEMFFFNNPINTRYSYTVTKVEVKDDKLVTKIEIADKVNPKEKRTYEKTVEYTNTPEFKAKQKVLKAQIQEMQRLFNQLYKSLGLDDKIDYDDLGNDNLQQTLFSMVDLATKLVTIPEQGKEFKKEWNAQVVAYTRNLQQNSTNQDNILESARAEIRELFLRSLMGSTLTLEYIIDSTKEKVQAKLEYWKALFRAYDRVMQQFELSLKKHKEIIEKNFKNNKSSQNQIMKLRVLEDLYNKIEKDIFRLKGIASENPTSILGWFDRYTNYIKVVKEEFNLLRDLGSAQELNASKPKELSAFTSAYDKAKKELDNQYVSQNRLKVIFGSILMVLGIISIIANAIVLLTKYKTNKKRKIIIVYALIIAISLIMAISGIVLLTLGVKGI